MQQQQCYYAYMCIFTIYNTSSSNKRKESKRNKRFQQLQFHMPLFKCSFVCYKFPLSESITVSRNAFSTMVNCRCQMHIVFVPRSPAQSGVSDVWSLLRGENNQQRLTRVQGDTQTPFNLTEDLVNRMSLQCAHIQISTEDDIFLALPNTDLQIQEETVNILVINIFSSDIFECT